MIRPHSASSMHADGIVDDHVVDLHVAAAGDGDGQQLAAQGLVDFGALARLDAPFQLVYLLGQRVAAELLGGALLAGAAQQPFIARRHQRLVEQVLVVGFFLLVDALLEVLNDARDLADRLVVEFLMSSAEKQAVTLDDGAEHELAFVRVAAAEGEVEDPVVQPVLRLADGGEAALDPCGKLALVGRRVRLGRARDLTNLLARDRLEHVIRQANHDPPVLLLDDLARDDGVVEGRDRATHEQPRRDLHHRRALQHLDLRGNIVVPRLVATLNQRLAPGNSFSTTISAVD